MGQDYKACLTNRKILKLSSQGCRAGDLVLYSESIKRGSDHPSGRGGKTGHCQQKWQTELSNQEETPFLDSQ